MSQVTFSAKIKFYALLVHSGFFFSLHDTWFHFSPALVLTEISLVLCPQALMSQENSLIFTRGL